MPLAPDIAPVQEPNYLGWARPENVGQPNQAGEILGKTIGNALADIGKMGDKFFSNLIDTDIHKQYDPLMEKQQQDLATTTQALTKGTIAGDDGNPVSVHDLLSKPAEQQTPTDLKNLGTIMDNLRAGKDHGSYSNVYFAMQKDKIAKELRTQYPQFRDYIDGKIKDAEGSTANEVIRAQISDLNALLSMRDKQKDKVDNEGWAHIQYPSVAQAMIARMQGKEGGDDLSVLKAIASETGHVRNLETRNLEASDDKNTFEQKQRAVEQNVASEFSRINTYTFNNLKLADGDWKTAADALRFVDQASTGQLKDEEGVRREPTQQELDQAVYLVKTAQRVARSKMEQALETRLSDDKPDTWRSTLTSDKSTRAVNDSMNYWDKMVEALESGNLSAASWMKRANESFKEQAVQNLLHSSAGEFASQMITANAIAGPEVAKDVLRNALGNTRYNAGIAEWGKQAVNGMIINSRDHRITLEDKLNEARIHQLPPEIMKDVITSAHDVLNDPRTKDLGKFNVAESVFGPGNQDAFKHLKDDEYNNKNQLRPGKYSVAATLTDEATAKTMWELGKRNAQTWTDYTNTVTKQWLPYLFNNAIKDFNRLQLSKTATVNYDDETQQFHYDGVNGADLTSRYPFIGMTPSNDAHFMIFKRDLNEAEGAVAVNRINVLTQSLANVAKAMGADPNAYVIAKLQEMGYDSKGGPGLGNMLVKAAGTSQTFDYQFKKRSEGGMPGANIP